MSKNNLNYYNTVPIIDKCTNSLILADNSYSTTLSCMPRGLHCSFPRAGWSESTPVKDMSKRQDLYYDKEPSDDDFSLQCLAGLEVMGLWC